MWNFFFCWLKTETQGHNRSLINRRPNSYACRGLRQSPTSPVTSGPGDRSDASSLRREREEGLAVRIAEFSVVRLVKRGRETSRPKSPATRVPYRPLGVYTARPASRRVPRLGTVSGRAVRPRRRARRAQSAGGRGRGRVETSRN